MAAPMQIDEGMQKVLIQLQQQYQDAARQLQLAKSQLTARQRDHKMTTLTLREIDALAPSPSTTQTKDDLVCYRGVGRMFIQESRTDIQKNLESRMDEFTKEVATLDKKIKRLESEMTTAQGSIRDVIMEHQKNA
ncbi:hypothetical protein OIO90_000524 [Microbotryomycetes sp. JL221]|nr:hypothetical protein OIO90_000524 [Microbotryomycetes sp. JL221]